MAKMADDRKSRAEAWFAELRDRLCAAFEALEDALAGPGSDDPPGRFVREAWRRPGGGGGEMAIMRGRVFEKVGVNVSTVWGELAEEFRGQIPGTAASPRFWASGVSLVAHMRSPLVPAAHMNTRHVVTEKSWFGGGADLTPTFADETDSREFHAALEAACDGHDPAYYPRFKKWADEYFLIAHRGEARGVAAPLRALEV